MQGASRDALAHAWTYVERQLTRAATAAATTRRAVGEELFGVVAVLDAQVGLRRALSDPLGRRRPQGRPGRGCPRLACVGRHASHRDRSRPRPVVTHARPRRRARDARRAGDVDSRPMLIPAAATTPASPTTSKTSCSGSAASSRRNAALRAALADPALPDENKVSLGQRARRRQGAAGHACGC